MSEEFNEREWQAHDKDHDREHQVARETAQRLEREVKETAERIDRAVNTALLAVTERARIHTEAHNREHIAHERIHSVEKIQVDKAEAAMNERLERMNEFRAALQDAAARMVTRDVLDAYMKDRENRLQAVIDRVIALEKSAVSGERVDAVQSETRRQRNGFLVAVALLGLGVVINLIVNLVQQTPT